MCKKLLKTKKSYCILRKTQTHALEDLKPKEIKAMEYKSDEKKEHIKYRKVFNEFSNERRCKI